jgi:hypothetical protein
MMEREREARKKERKKKTSNIRRIKHRGSLRHLE